MEKNKKISVTKDSTQLKRETFCVQLPCLSPQELCIMAALQGHRKHFRSGKAGQQGGVTASLVHGAHV